MLKKITVIIAHLNSHDNLAKCLESLIQKSFAHKIKVHVQDGGSKPSITNIIEKYMQKLDVTISVEEDTGIYDAWNKALTMVDTDFVCFLGSDDRLTNNWDALLNKAMESQGNFITGRALMKKKENYLQLGRHTNKYLWPVIMNVVHSGSIFHTTILTHYKFEPTFRVAGDYVQLLQARKRLRYSFLDQVVVIMDGEGISQRQGELGISEILSYLKSDAKIVYIAYYIKVLLRKLRK